MEETKDSDVPQVWRDKFAAHEDRKKRASAIEEECKALRKLLSSAEARLAEEKPDSLDAAFNAFARTFLEGKAVLTLQSTWEYFEEGALDEEEAEEEENLIYNWDWVSIRAKIDCSVTMGGYKFRDVDSITDPRFEDDDMNDLVYGSRERKDAPKHDPASSTWTIAEAFGAAGLFWADDDDLLDATDGMDVDTSGIDYDDGTASGTSVFEVKFALIFPAAAAGAGPAAKAASTTPAPAKRQRT